MIDKSKNERINITLSKEAVKMLDELASKEVRTRSQQIEKFILDYYKNNSSS